MLSSLLKHSFVFTLGIVAVLGLLACSSSIAPIASLPAPLVSTRASAESSSPSPMASALLHLTLDMFLPDVIITPAKSGQITVVTVGQVIGVANPGLTTAWQVSYASEVLEILTPAESLHSPGPQGWLFRAIAPGQTDLLLTSTMQPCPSATPCPPIPARFVFTIEVK